MSITALPSVRAAPTGSLIWSSFIRIAIVNCMLLA